VRPLDALRRRTHLSGGRADSIHTAPHDAGSTVVPCELGTTAIDSALPKDIFFYFRLSARLRTFEARAI